MLRATGRALGSRAVPVNRTLTPLSVRGPAAGRCDIPEVRHSAGCRRTWNVTLSGWPDPCSTPARSDGPPVVRADSRRRVAVAVAGVAYIFGGWRAVMLAGIGYGVIVMPLVFLVFTVDGFRRGLRRK